MLRRDAPVLFSCPLRRQNAFARKSRERAGGDAASSSATGVTDALLKMEQQVRFSQFMRPSVSVYEPKMYLTGSY